MSRRRVVWAAVAVGVLTATAGSGASGSGSTGGTGGPPQRSVVIESDIGAFAVAATNNGRAVYVVANRVAGPSTEQVEIIVRRQRDDGSVVWSRAVGRAPALYARGVAVDTAGSAYVAGWKVTEDRGDDALLLKYGPRGKLLWARAYDDVFHGDDRANSVAVDANGDVWMAGSVPAAGDGSSKVWWSRWSANGTRLGQWTAQSSIIGRAEAFGVAAVPGAAGVVLVGSTFEVVDGQVSTAQDVWISRVDPDGSVRWSRTFGRPGVDDAAHGVAVAATGAVYVTGVQSGAGGDELWVRRYSATGTLAWQKVVSSAMGDSGRSVAVSPDGERIAVAGVRGGGTFDADALVLVLGPSGGREWSRVIDSPGLYAGDSTPDGALGIAVPGPVFVVGRAGPVNTTTWASLPWVARLRGDTGRTVWDETIGD